MLAKVFSTILAIEGWYHFLGREWVLIFALPYGWLFWRDRRGESIWCIGEWRCGGDWSGHAVETDQVSTARHHQPQNILRVWRNAAASFLSDVFWGYEACSHSSHSCNAHLPETWAWDDATGFKQTRHWYILYCMLKSWGNLQIRFAGHATPIPVKSFLQTLFFYAFFIYYN